MSAGFWARTAIWRRTRWPPAYRTRIAQAIAVNDDAVRRLFGGGIMQFSAGNCAINRDIVPDAFFNENFRFAEDLELASRIGAAFPPYAPYAPLSCPRKGPLLMAEQF